MHLAHYVFNNRTTLMEKKGIILMGLGPGDPDLLTRQAWDVLSNTPEIYVRTRSHPALDGFPKDLQVYSFDEVYEEMQTFEEVYAQIVESVLRLGRRSQGVVYAVPGHPFIAEATPREIARRARLEGIPVRVVEGLSFLEVIFTALGEDPLPHTALVDALELVTAHVPPFPADAPALVAQVYSRQVASDVKLTLMEVYPDEHPVRLVHAAGTPQVQVEELPLYEIDRSGSVGLLTTLYVPPLGSGTSLEAFQEIVAHLRAPDGCPWDREQTHQSLRSSLLEETYEVLAALDADDPLSLREELGDLLLQIVLHAQIANEYGEFALADVIQGIHTKIIARHPHVFGDVQVDGVKGVLQNWEQLKAAERKANGKEHASTLDSVPKALPALAQAEQYTSRAARLGFEWPTLEDVFRKVMEELDEIRQAQNPEEMAQEIGDLLLAAVDLARFYKVEAESALRDANGRFKKRFAFIEEQARLSGRKVPDLSLDEMLDLWKQAKKN
jgi:tetrapyrrole methylase family protein/MazG family protein